MTTATINPAILDVHTMKQAIEMKSIHKVFGDLLDQDFDYTLETSSVEEFKEFNLKVYAKDSVERIASRISEDTMIFKVETIENYGQEDFVGKRFYQLRKWNNKFFFNELSVSCCIHARGFIPVSIVRTEEDEFKVKFLNHYLGEGKRIIKSEEGRQYIQDEARHLIWSDM
jgi:hypothetical protein